MKSVTNILFYLEDEIDDSLLERAANVARDADARLTLAVVVESAPSHPLLARRGRDPDEIERLLVEERQTWLEQAAARIGAIHPAVAVRVFVGNPVESVLKAVQDEGFDLLVKSPSPSQDLRQQLFGGIDMHLMRGCPCPVLITRAKAGERSGCAVAAVAYDADDETYVRLNYEILDSAAFVLKTKFAAINQVHVVHAWKMYGESMLAHGRARLPEAEFQAAIQEEEEKRRQWLATLIEDCRKRMDAATASAFQPKLVLIHEDPKIAIPEYVREVDAEILSMGTVARRGIGGLVIGNTAEEILNRVSCSVVTRKTASTEPPPSG